MRYVVVALEVKILPPWFDLLLLCTNHTLTPWLAQRRELGAWLPLCRFCCTAVHTLQLSDAVAARLSGCVRKKNTAFLGFFSKCP